MEEKKRTAVISLASIKGGVGKTHIAILLADCLAAAGKRVLLVDSDLNNSLSYHYLDGEGMERTRRRNLAAALGDESNDLCDFTVPARAGVDLIASTPHLADMRTLSERRLKRMVPTLHGKYDAMIIDCHPTYDNIVLNALHASDYVISPVLKDLFSYNAAAFLAGVLPRDLGEEPNWHILLNGYDRRFGEAKSGRQNDFLELYRRDGFPLTPPETWLPWTAQMHSVIDYGKPLSCRRGVAGAVHSPALHLAVSQLAGCFFDGLQVPEVF